MGEVTGTVKGNKVVVKWKVVYLADHDDSTSAQELQEKGYTLPEYHFVPEYGGEKFEQSPVLKVKGKAKLHLIDKETGKPLSAMSCKLYLADGSIKRTETDSEGYIKIEGLPFGIASIEPDEDKLNGR